MKTFTKVLSFILAVAMLLSVASFNVFAEDAEEVVALTDVDTSSTVGKAVSRLVSLGIINGYPDGTFKPDNTITRAEFCVVMVKFEGMQDFINPDAYTGFEDLDTDENYAWVRPYVAMAVNRGIINGFEDGTFRAADPVTYEQAIKMIMCSLGYKNSAQIPTITGDWSSGYVAKAMQLGVTKGTSIVNKTNPTTRGTVAVLTSNALDAEKEDITTESGDVIIGGDNAFADLDYDEVKGIVTGTYITELEDANSYVPKNHIQIEDEIYEIGFSRNPNELLGCYVEATIYKNSDGDYPLVKSITPTKKTDVITVNAGLVGEYDGESLMYQTSKESKTKTVNVDEDYIVIFNNKYDEEYDIAKLEEELVNGYVDLVDNDGDKSIDVVRVNSYEVYVVASKSNSSQKITLMYDAEYDGESTLMFPEESTSVIFSLTRNGKEIKFSDIAKWDVLNIKRSNEELDGKMYYEVVVTRDTVSGIVDERDTSDAAYIVVGGKEYSISASYLDLIAEEHEDAATLVPGDSVQVYLDAFNQIVAAAKATVNNSAESYAYLLSLRQDSDKSEYDLEFWLYTTKGKYLEIGAAEKITIDGTKYKALDDDILDYLEDTAETANKTYPDADGTYIYQQPIIYQTNSDGLVSVIYTVESTENEDISQVMEDEDGDSYFVPYDVRQYKSSSKSFTDFKVSSSSKIIFVPDNRSDTDEYLTFSSYSKAFANARNYHVEAYGLTSSKTASLVLIYHENDSRIYTSSSPWMIVASKSQTATGTHIKGYQGTSYSLKNVTVDEDDGPSISAIGKGDIIRYIVNSEGNLIDYQIWFDASDPAQLENISNAYDEAYAEGDDIQKRIIEIHSTNTEPRKDYPTSTFRLQYGTVTGITLKSEDDTDTVDEQTINISPYIVGDGVDIMGEDDDRGFISEEIGSSVKVFQFDRSSRNADVITEADLSEILDYENYEDDATRVIVFTASGTLRMIYIINE